MSDAWDADDYEPPAASGGVSVKPSDKWEGEDEDDDVKDAWDADSDEEDEKAREYYMCTQSSANRPQILWASFKSRIND